MASKQEYTAQEMIDAIKAAHGIKAAVARRLGCDWKTVHNYCTRYATVQAAVDEAREGVIDMAEVQLYKKVNAGEWPAVKFVLTTIGSSRGYVQTERHEHGGFDGGPIVGNVTVTIVNRLDENKP